MSQDVEIFDDFSFSGKDPYTWVDYVPIFHIGVFFIVIASILMIWFLIIPIFNGGNLI